MSKQGNNKPEVKKEKGGQAVVETKANEQTVPANAMTTDAVVEAAKADVAEAIANEANAEEQKAEEQKAETPATPAPTESGRKPAKGKEMRAMLKAKGYPEWVWRDPQDVNTYNVQQEYVKLGYSQAKAFEQFRKPHGHLEVFFNVHDNRKEPNWGDHWMLRAVLNPEWEKTAEGQAFLKDFAEVMSTETAKVKANLSGISSEFRHVTYVAKMLAAKHKLAFAQSTDAKEKPTTAKLTSKERRAEVYKRIEAPEAPKPEAQTAEQKPAEAQTTVSAK